MQCRDVMLTLVYKCTEHTPAIECARLMRDEKLGFMPVVDSGGKLVGVVTDRDLTIRLLASDLPSSTPVRDLMSTGPLLTCDAEESLHGLEARMGAEKRSRAVVVNAGREPVGIISLSDIARIERSAARTGRLLQQVAQRESVALVHG